MFRFAEVQYCFYRIITGNATLSKKPPASQHWRKNVQAGGGAILPCKWTFKVKRVSLDNTIAKLRAAIAEIEGGESMEVKVTY